AAFEQVNARFPMLVEVMAPVAIFLAACPVESVRDLDRAAELANQAAAQNVGQGGVPEAALGMVQYRQGKDGGAAGDPGARAGGEATGRGAAGDPFLPSDGPVEARTRGTGPPRLRNGRSAGVTQHRSLVRTGAVTGRGRGSDCGEVARSGLETRERLHTREMPM